MLRLQMLYFRWAYAVRNLLEITGFGGGGGEDAACSF